MFDRFVFWRFARDLCAIQPTQVIPVFSMSFDGTYIHKKKVRLVFLLQSKGQGHVEILLGFTRVGCQYQFRLRHHSHSIATIVYRERKKSRSNESHTRRSPIAFGCTKWIFHFIETKTREWKRNETYVFDSERYWRASGSMNFFFNIVAETSDQFAFIRTLLIHAKSSCEERNQRCDRCFN